jgi:pimeloyl-ACP methyl ester carboxylesterase
LSDAKDPGRNKVCNTAGVDAAVPECVVYFDRAPKSQPSKLLFLPGAGGRADFWQPVAQRLQHRAAQRLFGWPGFGGTAVDLRVNGIDDLVGMVVAEIDQPSALIAQSMGGAIAMCAALQRSEYITHLVLTATSGGINIDDLHAADWRDAAIAGNPSLPRWFVDYRHDLSAELRSLQIPVLLLWGDADPISPIAVGERLLGLLPRAQLHVIADCQHDFANVHAAQLAPLIDAHLNASDGA